MSVATTLVRYLDSQRVAYEVHNLTHFNSAREAAKKLRVPAHAMVQAMALNDQLGMALAVIPADRQLDLELLSGLMGRTFEPATTAQVLNVFRDCDDVFIPALGDAYGVRMILDDTLVDNDTFYLIAGDSTHIIQLSSKNFLQVQRRAWVGSGFTVPAVDEGGASAAECDFGEPETPVSKVGAVLNNVQELPPMPPIAQKILSLSSDPNAGTKELAATVEMDPSLAAQVLRYARSSLFGYQGEIDSIHTAVSRVLGFDMVMNLALGLATAKSFKVQRVGPLGLDSFWRHAIYSAALVQALGNELSADKRPNSGLAYLSGLLHNFGHLLMGHLFKKEFVELNQLVVTQPSTPVVDLEEQVFDTRHDEVGAALMEQWGLPTEIVVAIREHHSPNYNGPHAVYAQLVMLADRILKNHDMGDAHSGELPEALLEELQLNEVQILMVMNRVLEDCESFNQMAQQLVA